MSKILFNGDDLALLLVISSSLIFITVLLRDASSRSNTYWLVVFLMLTAVASANIIIYWSPVIRKELYFLQPHTYLIAQLALLLSAPTLLFYTKSIIFREFKFGLKDFAHYTPALGYILFLPLIYWSMSTEQVKASATDYEVLYNNSLFWTATWFQHAVKITYGLATLKILLSTRPPLPRINSDAKSAKVGWLLVLVGGFLGFWLIQAAAQVFHEIQWRQVAGFAAQVANYFLFALVNMIVVQNLTSAIPSNREEDSVHDNDQSYEFTDEQITRLEKVIHEREPYLNSDLTLEELSKITSIPVRSLSQIINRHHEKNFFEYINEYRINRAAELLMDTRENRSVFEIMEESGFKSKSAFNRFFKKTKGMTPTQYKFHREK